VIDVDGHVIPSANQRWRLVTTHLLKPGWRGVDTGVAVESGSSCPTSSTRHVTNGTNSDDMSYSIFSHV